MRGRVTGKVELASRCVLIAGVSLAFRAPALRAQGAITASLVTPNPTAYVVDLQTLPAWAMLTVTNASGEDVQAQVSASLSRNGGDVLVATLGPSPAPFMTIPGAATAPLTTVITAPRLAPWSEFAYTGQAGQQIHDTGRLPDGDWTLCVTLTGLVGVQTQRPQPDVTACSTFIVRYPEAPQLLLPTDRSDVTLSTPVFQWTPVTGVDGASYRFRIVEMMRGQTPREAVEADRPVLETTVYRQTALVYSPAAYPLKGGACYAWQVQSVKLQGSDLQPILAPVGTNQGRSQIYTFCYRPPHVAELPDSLPSDTTPGTGIAFRIPSPGAYRRPGGIGYGAGAGGGGPPASAERAGSYGGAQGSQGAPERITANGDITAYGELYGLTGTGGQPARPDRTGRIQVNTTLSMANGLVQIPLQALISTDQVNFRQEIDRLGISPTWRDYTVHAGYYTPHFTNLTLADATLLGGGVEGHPGGLRFSAGYGRARRSIAPDSGQLVQPEYSRVMGVGQVGWEAPSGFLAEFTVVSARDDPNSLGLFGDTTSAASPQENLVLGVHGKTPFAARRLWLDVEGTRSTYRADRRATTDATADVAGSVGLTWQVPTWSAGGKVTYVGPGYHALGNSQLQSDQVRYEATGQLHEGTVSLGLQAGVQQNNLDHTLQSTTKLRGIYSFTMSWQATQQFGLDGSASNIVNDVQSTDPMLALKNVNRSFVLTPHLSFQTGTAQNVLTASGTWQTAYNSSPGITGLQDTRTGSAMLAYALTLPSGVSLTATGTFTQVKVDSLRTNLTTLYPALSFPLIQGRLNTMMGLQWTWSGIAGTSYDHEVYPQLNASFAVSPHQQVTLQLSHRHYAYGDAMPGAVFNENQGSLTWKYTF